MFRPIVVGLFGLVFYVGVSGAQPAGNRGRAPGAPPPPPLFFKETWRIMGAPHTIAPGKIVVANPNLELKTYGPTATAADPNKRIWISGPPEAATAPGAT